jgi:hypothetical protein
MKIDCTHNEINISNIYHYIFNFSGEVQVVTDNKTYLASHGVDITALESINSREKATKRSNTTILIKNLPANSIESELVKMFAM